MVTVILVVLGLCLGSFVNAFVWRVKHGKDWVRGRSVCVHCNHVLEGRDLVPVLSWLALSGKCRYCHKPISWQYPVVELLTAMLFVISYWYWPHDFTSQGVTMFVFWLVFLVGFMALAIYDLKWMLLPNKMVMPLAVLAGGYVLARAITFNGGLEVIIEAMWGIAIGGGIFYALFQYSSGKWIGGGDVKLGAVLGLLVGGPAASLLLIFLASALGSLVAIPMMLSRRLKSNSRMPFGPYLILAGFIVYIFGASIIAWYQNQLLI